MGGFYRGEKSGEKPDLLNSDNVDQTHPTLYGGSVSEHVQARTLGYNRLI